MDAPYALLERLEPGIGRVLAHNPSAFTYTGTQTYLVGEAQVAVIDPGPDLPDHVDALLGAIGGSNGGQTLQIEYTLTDRGRDLAPVILEMERWGQRWGGPHPMARAGDRAAAPGG